MKVEQSLVKVTISGRDYRALMAARDVILEMKELLYDNDLDGLGFYDELVSLEDSFDTFEGNFEENDYGDYYMEVD